MKLGSDICRWTCPNCGAPVIGRITLNAKYYGTCPRCRVITHKIDRSRRHITLEMYAPEGISFTYAGEGNMCILETSKLLGMAYVTCYRKIEKMMNIIKEQFIEKNKGLQTDFFTRN